MDKMTDTGIATLQYGDKSLELPILKGTVGPDVIDVRKLYADSDAFTFDPGFTSTASCQSGLTYIDGDAGILLHRGYPIDQLAKDPASETGGAFMTMKDNETLSGARDVSGARGGFGASREAAFVPKMLDLRRASDERSKRAVRDIVETTVSLALLLGLRDVFSVDFRIGPEGRPTLFEFEVCPGVTIYDFQNYLAKVHGLSLGEALAKSFVRAFARARVLEEA